MSGKKTPREKKTDEYIKLLKSENVNERIRAAEILSTYGLGSEKLILALIKALNDVDWRVRFWVSVTLGMLGKTAVKALPHLKNSLRQERDTSVKFNLAIAITKIEEKRGEGTKVIEQMKRNDVLEEFQDDYYEILCKRLLMQETFDNAISEIDSLESTVTEVKETVSSTRNKIKSQNSETQEVILPILEGQEKIIKSLEDSMNKFSEQIKEMSGLLSKRTVSSTKETYHELALEKMKRQLAKTPDEEIDPDKIAEHIHKIYPAEEKWWKKNLIPLINIILTITLGVLVVILEFKKT